MDACLSGGGLRPTVEAVWLQWPTPGAPSAAIELNGKGAILCVFIFHAAFGEHGDFNSHRSTPNDDESKTFLSLRPCLKRRDTPKAKLFITHGDVERRTRSLRRARSVERRLGHTTCCFCRRSSHRLRAVWVPSCVTFPLS